MQADRDEVLQELLVSWFDRRERGESPDAEAVCEDHPELLEDFRRLVAQDPIADEALLSFRSDDEIPVATVGGFRLLERLGSGGMGDVYLAREELLGRLVALKILRHDEARDPNRRERFQREAEIAAGLDHPNIVPVYSVGEAEGHVFIAMKRLTGPALDEILLPLPESEVCRIGVAAARALHAAHEAGVIHRDVKPGNVMLDDGRPYLLDFGLARGVGDLTVTREGVIPGTLPYMSPEQIRAGTSTTTLDARCDVYSLGATLHEMVSGEPPFRHEDVATLIHRILTRDPPRPSGAGRDLATIIWRALEKDRDRRYPNAGELADDLERLSGGFPIRARRVGPVGRFSRLARRHPRTTVVLGIALLSCVGLVGKLVYDQRSEERNRMRLVARIETELAQGSLDVAEELVGTLPDGDEDRRALLDRTRACVLLEEALDEIQDRREALNLPWLSDHLATIRRLGLPPGDGRRARSLALTEALIEINAERVESALEILSGLEESRGVRALRVLARGDEDWRLPSETSQDVMDHVFTIIALRAAGRPARERGQEIELAKRQHMGDLRLRYAEAVWHAEQGEEEEAFSILQGPRPKSGYRRGVLRNLMRSAYLLGNTEFLTRFLAEFRARFDRDATWSPTDAASVVRFASALGEEEAAEEDLNWALSRWGDDWQLRVLDGERKAYRGDLRGAAEVFQRARADATTPHERESATLALLHLQAETLSSWNAQGANAAPQAEIPSLESIRDLAFSIVEASTSVDRRLNARVLAAHALRILREPEAAAELLAEKDARSSSPEFVLELGDQAVGHQRIFNLAGTHPLQRDRQEQLQLWERVYGPRTEHLRAVRARLRELIQDPAGLRASTRQVHVAWFLDARLANGLEDYEAVLEAGRRVGESHYLPADVRHHLLMRLVPRARDALAR